MFEQITIIYNSIDNIDNNLQRFQIAKYIFGYPKCPNTYEQDYMCMVK